MASMLRWHLPLPQSTSKRDKLNSHRILLVMSAFPSEIAIDQPASDEKANTARLQSSGPLNRHEMRLHKSWLDML
jgi:hypothetical protein